MKKLIILLSLFSVTAEAAAQDAFRSSFQFSLFPPLGTNGQYAGKYTNGASVNLIAGLLRPTSGTLRSDSLRPAYVFQEPRLFPWLTVEQNLRAVLPPKADPAVIADALALVELPDAGRLFPAALSGGMKTRVSLARALVYGGDLMLLDEPFAALNEELRTQLLHRLKARLKQTGSSAILVTHQREDAEAFADRIKILP